ncbi:tRNA (cytidine/uridine-2'-O-)-methyltransferase [Breznakia sp. PF5-3]|uniref:tRNA (cytidine(34)-2'-O)-methyltransferase n=1 Tax=unclassified Breznakia TaxID=2623764 RepID=UPI002406492B|nr:MULTISPECIES: tRNA (cytidine(34)-2'-O)-methyltransferase [unclassified Breznakia]MDL2276206.1 tRNA (cytidine(34)-2'-O)-methyltransferase [Breznakia sp. OttesenSCG-928-G09]MDF9824727.1 tRNA (cytidine/uridine-2'-O-)-methyltransferase [Breznakia sp. PM6-1]MDF9835390.1 tRNA (cytidine/uridine-2'-O-)-methyltransferase [Breznakia sp. PF5-3]MDF9836989.1 tRNA (cytidine/uridine-2'-O-)-methyltransferase [Breznakia sp. PFB2-8]MDF9859625.1 tRNA (cytidine/uridine-2'-O-)-methyltransferase [Breznakia sp. P
MIHIVLYEPEIPQNTGNIMRTCLAMNCKLHLIEPLGFYLDEQHLRRAGMDYIKDVEYVKYADWDAFLEANPNGDKYFISRYAKKSPDEFSFSSKQDIYLVFGKESTGIPKNILKSYLDSCIRLPMVASARSMNLSNCVAIMAYEVNKQLGYPGLVKHETLKGEDFLDQ